MAGSAAKRKWRSEKALREAINGYFADCEEKGGHPSLVGLSLALGFSGRQELCDYLDRDAGEGEKGFVFLTAQARSRVEEINLQAVYEKETSAGAKFVLQSCFGYGDKEKGSPPQEEIRVTLTDPGG